MNLDTEAKRRNIEGLGRSDTAATLAYLTLFVVFLLLAFPVPSWAWEGQCTGVSDGDTLSIRVTVLEAKLSQSKSNQGTIRHYTEVLNQHREVVMAWKGMGMYRCRDKDGIGGP